MTTKVYAVPRRADGSWDFDAATEIVPPVRFEAQTEEPGFIGCELPQISLADAAVTLSGSVQSLADAIAALSTIVARMTHAQIVKQ